MYAKSLESTRYLLLTEFEGRTACNRTSFFRSDLWPKHKVRRSHKLSRKKQVSTYTQHLCYKATKFSEVSASCIERRREMDEIRTEWSMTLPRIPVILTALEINLPNGSFLKNFLYTKHHNMLFAGVYCHEKRFISRKVTIL